jgi:16S rRNA processing protein RimM
VVAIESEWIIIGKFGRPQGIKGLVRVISFTEPRDNILQYPDWFIQKQGSAWQKIDRLDERVNPQHILAQIDGYATREAISQLTNIDIAVQKTTLPELNTGEYYWHELIGMRVIHNTGAILGIVDSILDTGANDVLVIIDKENNKKHLVPYILNDVVQNISKTNREMTVCWDLDF